MLTFAIDALAVYRLTRLIIDDEILREPRVAILERLEPEGLERPGEGSKIAYMLSCPWCVSPYVAAGVLACRAFFPKTWHYLATALALSAAAGYLSEH